MRNYSEVFEKELATAALVQELGILRDGLDVVRRRLMNQYGLLIVEYNGQWCIQLSNTHERQPFPSLAAALEEALVQADNRVRQEA